MGRKGVLRAINYDQKKVFFKHLILPMDNQFGVLGLIWSMVQ
jgi:hypothetical protein